MNVKLNPIYKRKIYWVTVTKAYREEMQQSPNASFVFVSDFLQQYQTNLGLESFILPLFSSSCSNPIQTVVIVMMIVN